MTGPADEVTGYSDGVGEPAGQSVMDAAQLVTVTSVVTSTVEVPQLSPYWPGGPQAGEATTEVARAAATMAYFIFADLLFWGFGSEGFEEEVVRK